MTQVNNSPIKDYVHQNNHTQPTYEMTPVFKPFAVLLFYTIILLVLMLYVTSQSILTCPEEPIHCKPHSKCSFPPVELFS